MGITLHYRGTLADLDRLEDFEDRIIDLALELGGLCRLWRTSADHDPQRVVRGVIVDLVPGQESTSLLISPEGWLIGLVDIEDAERGTLDEPPWCFVKTQFGPVEGHVALVELFTALKREFILTSRSRTKAAIGKLATSPRSRASTAFCVRRSTTWPRGSSSSR